MENIIDTFLNIVVFVFIGLLIWLYFKKSSAENDPKQRKKAGGNAIK